jgi:hypothetical protein
LVGLALSALCLFLAARKISLAALQEALSTAKWMWVVLATGATIGSASLKAVRWRALFLPLQIPLVQAWTVSMIGQMLNAVLPARAGDIGRVLLIGEEENEASWALALSTVVTEKVVDLAMLALLYLIVALWLTTTPSGVPDWLQAAGRFLIPLAVLGLAGLLLLAYFGRPIWNFASKALSRLSPHWRTKIDSIANQAIAGLDALRYGPARRQVWGWSLLIWAMMTWTNALLFKAFDLDLSPFVAALLLLVLMSAIAVPRLPGSQGVLVYLCALVLSLFGVSGETALLYGITLQAVVHVPVLVLGSIGMFWTSRSLAAQQRQDGSPGQIQDRGRHDAHEHNSD